jgi:hypothetical protein
MPNLIHYPHVAVATFTITLASLGSSSAGVGRQSTLIDNDTTWRMAARIYLRIQVGTTPTADTLIHAYLILSSDDATTPIRNDNAGASDAAWTALNAEPLGTLLVDSATSDLYYYGIFDTWKHGPLGPQWGIGIVNATGVALGSTEGNHIKQYRYYDPEVQ